MSKMPMINLENSSLIKNNATLLVDTGSSVNIIKVRSLDPRVWINKRRIYNLIGIGKDMVNTLGETKFIVKGLETPFQVVLDSFPIQQDGILGVEALRQHHAVLNFIDDCLHLGDQDFPLLSHGYPLPNITDILDQLGGAKYFSVMDLASGFHQIPMDPNSQEKTAFSTPYAHLEFTRMPFGLKNAPATFQRVMDQVLTGLQGVELFVYMDDIVIYAQDLKEHDRKLRALLLRLRDAGLTLQPEKCHFLRREITYLGHIITREGVKPDPRKIEAVKNFPIPRTKKNIKQFLGLIGYYRRFIPEFAKISKPLTHNSSRCNLL